MRKLFNRAHAPQITMPVELDAAIAKGADLLREHFGREVVIRFTEEDTVGGIWLVDSKEDTLGCNCNIGLCAKLYCAGDPTIPKEATMVAQNTPCSTSPTTMYICYETVIDLKNTEHRIPSDSPYILMNHEYRNFDSLEKAADYLFSHVVGIKENTCVPLEQRIASAEAKANCDANSGTQKKFEVQK